MNDIQRKKYITFRNKVIKCQRISIQKIYRNPNNNLLKKYKHHFIDNIVFEK